MKLYFDLNDICDVPAMLDRVDQDNNRFTGDSAKAFYAFTALYAAYSLRAIINGVAGNNFVTYVPVKPANVFSNMTGVWSHDTIIDLRVCFDTIEMNNVVRFNNVIATVDHALLSEGKTFESIKDASHIHIDLTNPKGTVVCLEC
ncbi:hypothetical protein PARSHIK_32 [Erwinia phage vB_EamM_Parshik]|nr:hypothetical protein PARSHIK_32 [Erwinia phage vB_EamM_Parshik]